jgi:hypothetical protein
MQPQREDLFDEDLTGLITTDRWLKTACTIAGVLGATITALGWLVTARWHLNRTARRHRP